MLDDPKHSMGGTETIHAVARPDLADAAPVAVKLIRTLHLSEQQLTSLELAIADARSPYGGVRRWLDAHPHAADAWVNAAREIAGRELY